MRDRRGAGAGPLGRGDPAGACCRFPASRTAWSRSTRQGAECCSSTIRRRPMRMPPRARSRASRIFSGLRAVGPRPAVSRRLPAIFPRIRKAYLIGEAAGEFAGTLQGKAPFVVAGTLDRAVELRGAEMPLPRTRKSRSCCSRPPVRPMISIRNFELRGTAFREAVMKREGVVKGVIPLSSSPAESGRSGKRRTR